MEKDLKRVKKKDMLIKISFFSKTYIVMKYKNKNKYTPKIKLKGWFFDEYYTCDLYKCLFYGKIEFKDFK